MPQYFDNNPDLASKPKYISFTIQERDFSFKSDIGVFSKNQVDEGTKAFLKVLLTRPLSGKILDMGCGYGALGLTLASFFPQSTFVLADVNERALELAQENQKKAPPRKCYLYIEQHLRKHYRFIPFNCDKPAN